MEESIVIESENEIERITGIRKGDYEKDFMRAFASDMLRMMSYYLFTLTKYVAVGSGTVLGVIFVLRAMKVIP